MSKYKGVDEAVKWSWKFLKSLQIYYDHAPRHGVKFALPNDARKDAAILSEKLNVSFLDKLETKLVSEIDGKINENNGTLQRVRNIRKHEIITYGVDLQKAVRETLDELGLPSWQTKFIAYGSKVSPNYFAGYSGIAPEHKSAIYDSRQLKTIDEAILLSPGNKWAKIGRLR